MPLNLRSILGQFEVVRSLETKNMKTAGKAALEMAETLDSLFIKIRNGLDLLSQKDMKLVSDHVIETNTKPLLKEALESFDDRTNDEVDLEAFHARTFRNEALANLKHSRLNTVKPQVNGLLKSHDVTLDESSAAYKQLCRAALKGLAEAYTNAEIIVKGELENPRLNFGTTDIASEEEAGLTFQLAIQKYFKDNETSWSKKQQDSQLAQLTYFLDYACELDGKTKHDRTLESVSASDTRSYKEHLQQVPTNAKKLFPNLSPSKAVSAAKDDNCKTLSTTTINKYLQCLSSLYNFAIKELDYDGANVFKGRSNTKLAKKSQRQKRNSFSREQLSTFLKSPLYTGCKSIPSCHRPGDLIPNESHKYWVPLIGLFTGMRMQEILQLYLEDIYEKEGIWVFDLNENHSDKKLKTLQSRRLVPIHNKLIELGLLKLWQKRSDEGGYERLFPDVFQSNDDTYSSIFSKWFGRYIKHIGIKTTRTSFHSFRHNIKDLFRESGESDELAESFVGRTTGTVGADYGGGFSLKRLHEALHKLQFPDF